MNENITIKTIIDCHLLENTNCGMAQLVTVLIVDLEFVFHFNRDKHE